MSRKHRIWTLPDREITSEEAYTDRRDILKILAAASLLPVSVLPSCEPKPPALLFEAPDGTYPVKKNTSFRVPERYLTDEHAATHETNFYEFSLNKQAVPKNVTQFQTKPWKVEIKGLVERAGTADIEDFFKHLDSEERIYRFRCVEGWAMTVPWSGFPMKKFVEWVRPLPEARFVKMKTFFCPEEAINQKNFKHYPWPYYEALSLAEATNELTMLAHGIYQRDLPRQNGAPLRLVVPWKYGMKSIKSIVEFEFTKERPPTFWTDQLPSEYSWDSNVDPRVPHPRWAQTHERLIPNGELRETMLYNGYADQVAELYG